MINTLILASGTELEGTITIESANLIHFHKQIDEFSEFITIATAISTPGELNEVTVITDEDSIKCVDCKMVSIQQTEPELGMDSNKFVDLYIKDGTIREIPIKETEIELTNELSDDDELSDEKVEGHI